jgi:hypothetical protein
MRTYVRYIVTARGHPYSRLQRGLKTGNAALALDAARELRRLTLEDALGLCLILRTDSRRYQRATARWLSRYHAEVEMVTLSEIQEVADLLAALPVFGADAGEVLAAHLERRGLHRCAGRVRDLAA